MTNNGTFCVYVYIVAEWRDFILCRIFCFLNSRQFPPIRLTQFSFGKLIDQPSTTRSKPHENKLQVAPISSLHATEETMRR